MKRIIENYTIYILEEIIIKILETILKNYYNSRRDNHKINLLGQIKIPVSMRRFYNYIIYKV